MSYKLLSPFDPWKSKLCTCPSKLSFNPYTGCDHRCLYCYSTYIPNFYNARPKKRLIERLKREVRGVKEKTLISMSNSSDPYPPIEREMELTRKSIELFSKKNLRLLVLTKSDIVLRDVDLLRNMRSAVSITVTTLDNEIAEKIEPFAPKPMKRVRALKKLKDKGVAVILRFDPVMPYINDEEIERVIEELSFVDHVVSSTLKLRPDSFSRLSNAFPELKEKLRYLYFKSGEKIGNSFYLDAKLRKKILSRVAEICEKLNLSYAFCREGFRFKAESCDGSHLCRV